MTPLLMLSLGLAFVAGVSSAALVALWPRRVSAEEWVLHRRAVAMLPETRRQSRWTRTLPVIPSSWLKKPAYREAAKALERDLQFARLAGFTALPSTPEQFVEVMVKAAITGAVLGALLAVLAWRIGALQGVWGVALLFGFVGAGGGAAVEYRRVRNTARRLRRSVIRRLPRLITGARMVMESGAATPEGALAMAVSLYVDPAADLLREAIRLKEVHKLSLEDAIDQVGQHYGLDPFGRLADAFRIGRRYGTRLSDVLAGFAVELRREWHAAYRERITRAPVLMTIPALIFFVAPLLVLILFLVFSPLFTILSRL
jgi:Flp pilus assembly protein TadB